MVIAEFTASSSMRGKRIVRDGDLFEIEGTGPISADDILYYDDRGQLAWPDASCKDWVKRCAAGSEEVPPLVRDLVEAVSGAAEVQNRYWIAVAIVSLFALIPRPAPAPTEAAPVVALPFELPAVSAGIFMFVSVLLLGVLASAFGAALAHLVRTEQFAREMLPTQAESRVAGRAVGDFYEALRKPSLTRVSSIAHAVLNTHHVPFSFQESDAGVPRTRVAVGLYGFLKALVLLVWVLMPAVALIYSARRYFSIDPFNGVQGFGALILVLALCAAALVSLGMAGFLEAYYLVRTIGRSWPKAETKPQTVPTK